MGYSNIYVIYEDENSSYEISANGYFRELEFTINYKVDKEDYFP